jgi:hypothetical protein
MGKVEAEVSAQLKGTMAKGGYSDRSWRRGAEHVYWNFGEPATRNELLPRHGED